MQKYQNNVQDQFGNKISGVTVTIRDNPGGGLATIFSDNAGSAKSNPFSNDSEGEFFFYATDGRYDIELTGTATETLSDIRLLDITTSGTTLRINTDIVTATPPTTEAVTGTYDIYDLANNDRLAFFGFNGENALQVRNQMHGGNVHLTGENAAGTARQILVGDPDGTADLYYAGIKRLQADASGIVALYADGATDTETRYLSFRYSGGTARGLVGHNGNDILTIRNQVHGGNISLVGEDGAGVVHNILIGDPDAEFSLYHDGGLRVSSNTTGRMLVHSDGDTDTEQRSVNLCHLDGTVRGSYGYLTDGVLTLRNLIHGSGFLMTAEDAGGTARTILEADPDAVTTLRGDTNVEIQTDAGDLAIICAQNARVGLYYNAIERLRTQDHTVADSVSGAQVLDGNGVWQDIGFNVLGQINQDTAYTIHRSEAGYDIYKDGGGTVSYTIPAAAAGGQTDIPVGAVYEITNEDTEALTIDGTEVGITLRWCPSGGTGDRTLAQWGKARLEKRSDSLWFITGVGLT